MSDYLVRLYDLPPPDAERRAENAGIVLRRALAPETHVVLGWIGRHFSAPWVSEAGLGLAQQPASVLLAVADGEILGFACYDTTAKGLFGPLGVSEAARGKGVGEALLLATLRAMRGAGYAYAVIGSVGPVEFYRKRLDVLEIPGSTPGLYAGMVRDPAG